MFYNRYLHNVVTKFNAVSNKNRKETCFFFKFLIFFMLFEYRLEMKFLWIKLNFPIDRNR